MSYKKIFETLNAINIDSELKLIQGLSYLPWANAWKILMDHYPDAVFAIGADDIHADGSVTVNCSIQIGECTRSMWLPVMTGGRHAAIANPTARDISDARMRCFVKCLALYGLGLYVYRGEAGPSPEAEKPAEPARDSTEPVNSYEAARLNDLFQKLPIDAQTAFLIWTGKLHITEIETGAFDKSMKALHAKLRQLGI